MEVIRCLANDFIRLIANQSYDSEKDQKCDITSENVTGLDLTISNFNSTLN